MNSINRTFRVAFIYAVLLALFAACGEDGSSTEDSPNVKQRLLAGFAQKGPFTKGSKVSIQELDKVSLQPVGEKIEGSVHDDDGVYSLTFDEFESPYAMLTVEGTFRNELTGKTTKASVNLHAVVNHVELKAANINLLTHLEYKRVLYLVTEEGMTFAKAKKQAQLEVLAAFGIKGDFELAEDLNLNGGGDGNAALLAISVLMLGGLEKDGVSDRSLNLVSKNNGDGIDSSKLAERILDFVDDLEKDGLWKNGRTAAIMADWAVEQGLNGKFDSFRKPVQSYIDSFWWKVYGFDECDSKHEDAVSMNDNSNSVHRGVYFVCKNGRWSPKEKDSTQVKDSVEVKDSVQVKDSTDVKDTAQVSDTTSVTDTTVVKDTTENKDTVSFDYGKLVDARDGQAYHTIKIGIQNWMADDLNYGESSEYYWDDAKEVCPAGWHLPSMEEWNELFRSVGGLEASDFERFGMTLIPPGKLKTHFWTSSFYYNSIEEKLSYYMIFQKTGVSMARTLGSTMHLSVRCVQDARMSMPCNDATMNTAVHYNDMAVYVCQNGNWIPMSNDEYEDFSWTVGEESQAKWRENAIPRQCFVYESGAWHERDSSNCLLGLRGCTAARQGTVEKTSNNGMWYMCDNLVWKKVSDEMADSILLGTNYEEGEVLRCPATRRYCVFQDGKWREGTRMDSIMVSLGGTACLVEGDTSTVKYGDEYYVCKKQTWGTVSRSWQLAPQIYNDTYEDRDECSATGLYGDGSFHDEHDGAVGRVYVCENGGFRLPTQREMSLNRGCTSYIYGKKIVVNNTHFVCSEKGWKIDSTAWEYGTFTDARDGRVYKTIDIWGQTWMAENLDYRDSVTKLELEGNRWCYGNEAEQCDAYGSFYSCELSSQVCPAGWRLPSISDWMNLYNFIVLMGGDPQNGLRAKEGWSDNTGHSRNGTDVLGFTALPGGIMYEVGSYGDATRQAWFWYAQDCSLNEYEAFYLSSEEVNFVTSSVSGGVVSDAYSIRCIKD